MSRRRVLVTGAAGFIGSHLVKKLWKRGYEVVAFDRKESAYGNKVIIGDIVTYNFNKLFKNEDIDIVFHLAGLLGTTELFHRIIEAERVNVLGTLNLLEAMRKNDIDTIIFTSKPNVWKYNVYTITKENCERYLEMYREIYGFKVVITRPFNVYGPGENITEYRKAIPYFIVAALKNQPLEVFGDGTQTMDPIYIDDSIEALIRCAELLPREVVEIGSGIPVKVLELARKIISMTNSKSIIVFKPMRKGETFAGIIRANGSMEKLIGYKPKIDLNEGLRRTIKWYREHLNEFNKIYTYKEEDFY